MKTVAIGLMLAGLLCATGCGRDKQEAADAASAVISSAIERVKAALPAITSSAEKEELSKYIFVLGMVEATGDVNMSAEGKTALMWAACQGDSEVVKWLLERGANLNNVLNDKTALIWATERHHTQVADMLKASGAKQ